MTEEAIVVLWEAKNQKTSAIAKLETPQEIITAAERLSEREKGQLQRAFANGDYELACHFLWFRTMSALKSQLATMGMRFIGELLGRADIDEHSNIEAVSDGDAIRLAQELGIFGSTVGLRLTQSMEVLNHFAKNPETLEYMDESEAKRCLKSCVQGILCEPQLEVAGDFVKFRNTLERRTLSDTDVEVKNLLASPYFFRRTTLAVLLDSMKTASGAARDNALANAHLLIPRIWPGLRDTERWQIGQTYAELHNEGKVRSLSALKRVLVEVENGFDFVPETLRSSTFMRAAGRVIEAHEDWNNFYTETEPMAELAALGSVIPMPALDLCATASLCVWLGNSYGHSFEAAKIAGDLLAELNPVRWEFVLNKVLISNDRLLSKLTLDKPAHRWIQLVKERVPSEIRLVEGKPFVDVTSGTRLRELADAQLNKLRKS